MEERRKIAVVLVVFGVAFLLPVERSWVQRLIVGAISLLPLPFVPGGNTRVREAVIGALAAVHGFAHEHVIFGLVPALLLAGAVCLFVARISIVRLLGARASRWIAYPVAAGSGMILTVCSCTVLPVFSSIQRRGAGLGPAAAFLYAGPAINVLAIVLTSRVLGSEIGLARTAAALVFAIVIGILMHTLFGRGVDLPSDAAEPDDDEAPESGRRSRWDAILIALVVGILFLTGWVDPRLAGSIGGSTPSLMNGWMLVGLLVLSITILLVRWVSRDHFRRWLRGTWTLADKILLPLLVGLLLVGMLFGRPGGEALLPKRWVAGLMGEESFLSSLLAALVGALMYLSTLSEVPLVQSALRGGMAKGPALAILLAGPAVSLPSMVAMTVIVGLKKTLAYVSLVIVLSALAGTMFGAILS